MDKFLQEINAIQFKQNISYYETVCKLCNCLEILRCDIRNNGSAEKYLHNKYSEIYIYGDLNFDLDVIFSVILKNNARITGSIKCRKFISRQIISKITAGLPRTPWTTSTTTPLLPSYEALQSSLFL
jgi:hypothetical protein